MLQGKYKVISVGELTGDEIEIGEVLELNNGIFVFKDGYKTKKTYKTVEEFEEFWEIKIQKIETIKIKNRDFSFFAGKTSIDKWKNNVSFYNYNNGYSISFIREFYGGESEDSYIYLDEDKVSNKYIVDKFKEFGFEIEFEDAKDVDTFEELKELVKNKSELRIIINETIYLEVWYSEFEKWCDLPVEDIEKKYNVKLNILEDK